jgi:hypothetical protein
VRFPKGDAWTADQTEYLRENYLKLPKREIAARLNRSEAAVRRKALQLELGRCQTLTADEEEWLKRMHARSLGVAQIARIMKRSQGYIRKNCLLLGLEVKTRNPWRPEDDAKVIELAMFGETDNRIANIVNRSVIAVKSRRRTLHVDFGKRTSWTWKFGNRQLLAESANKPMLPRCKP